LRGVGVADYTRLVAEPPNQKSRQHRNAASRAPRWYGIPVRVAVVTFIGTLLSFSVSLLLAIVGTVLVARIRGLHPDMTVAYRHIALPMALVAGCVIFVLSLTMEVRHYRQTRALSALERIS
jgi:hypothetical protein